jgi:hypothetical protein
MREQSLKMAHLPAHVSRQVVTKSLLIEGPTVHAFLQREIGEVLSARLRVEDPDASTLLGGAVVGAFKGHLDGPLLRKAPLAGFQVHQGTGRYIQPY